MSGGESLTLPFPLGNLVPFLLSLMLMMGSTTASSISMEGKQWWIPKSLPIPARTILDSKMLVGLSLMLPAVLISGAVLVISGQTGDVNPVWLFLVPGAYACFSVVFGITAVSYTHLDVYKRQSLRSITRMRASSSSKSKGFTR